MKMAVVSDGKHAVTHITKIKSNENYSYAMANLETGRTHQIRVHMARVRASTCWGHPIWSS